MIKKYNIIILLKKNKKLKINNPIKPKKIIIMVKIK